MSTLTSIPEATTSPSIINAQYWEHHDKQKEVAKRKLMASIPTDTVATHVTKLRGKYLVFETGYTSRLTRYMPFLLAEYDTSKQYFVDIPTPKDVDLQPRSQDEEFECCVIHGDPCPHHSILCTIDTLWGWGLYLSKRYFDMSDRKKVVVSNDIIMIINSYNNKHNDFISGIVIFEDRMTHIPVTASAVVQSSIGAVSVVAPVVSCIDNQVKSITHKVENVSTNVKKLHTHVSISPSESEDESVVIDREDIGEMDTTKSIITNIGFMTAYDILKEFEYCAMFCITDIELVKVTQPNTGYNFHFTKIDVDSESG
jgi:hypothetical protein